MTTRTITPTIGEKIERPERRQDPPEDPQVRIADVVEETLDAVQPRRVRKPDPGRNDVREDEQHVDVDEDVTKLWIRETVSKSSGNAPIRIAFASDDSTPTASRLDSVTGTRMDAGFARVPSRTGVASARSEEGAHGGKHGFPRAIRLVEKAASLGASGRVPLRSLHVSGRQQEHLVGDALHAAVERVR